MAVPMSQMMTEIDDSLRDDLYRKTRAQLATFIDETNALLAAGDALREDRTALARDRLAAFLQRVADPETAPEPEMPPLTQAADSVRRYVKAHPRTALGVAAGCGLIASFFLARRS